MDRWRNGSASGPRPQTHGAGAAFSAGYAHAILSGADIPAALRSAGQAGATACTPDAADLDRNDTTATELAV